MTDTEHPDSEPGLAVPDNPTAATNQQGGHQMDSRMMWVMMAGCCLAIPLALILGGASLGGLAGASPWLIGAAVVLAVALLITRRISSGQRDDTHVVHRD